MKTKEQIVIEYIQVMTQVKTANSVKESYINVGRACELLWVLENKVDYEDIEQITEKLPRNLNDTTTY